MSLRPRFAGDGGLRRVMEVHVAYQSTAQAEQDDVTGRLGTPRAGRDPFERGWNGLLLVEEFARMTLLRRRHALGWYGEFGVVDLQHAFPDDGFTPDHKVELPAFHDALEDVRAQQRIVRWHLESLARLSDYFEAARAQQNGGDVDASWNPRWVQPAIQGPDELLWLGATTPAAAHIPTLVQQHGQPEDAFGRSWLPFPDGSGSAAYRESWGQAHANYQTIQAEGIETLWVPLSAWTEFWSNYDPAPSLDAADSGARTSLSHPLGTGPQDLVELERRLLLPYVKMAAKSEVEVEQSQPRHEESATNRVSAPLRIVEVHSWSSILAPIYLQLLEGLLRITEERRGAAFCRMCHQPFLTLDARRSTFCSDRERVRFTQREFRIRRGASPMTKTGEESAT